MKPSLPELFSLLDGLQIRMDVLVAGTRRCREELVDNPKRHLSPCKCGRMDTRFDCCPLCFQDRLRAEFL